MSKRIEITYDIAMAASRDAGDRSMRSDGRVQWSEKDWNVACETFERLYGTGEIEPPRAEQGEGGEG